MVSRVGTRMFGQRVSYEPSARMMELRKTLKPIKKKLADHPIYESITNMEQLRNFMSHHCVPVWDFMTLLKALQLKLTCVTLPWHPVGDVHTRRLINDIVMGEESDDIYGSISSHFEAYIDAMKEVGCDTTPILDLVDRMVKGEKLDSIAKNTKVPQAAIEFLKSTWKIIEGGNLTAICAYFCLGREEIIPTMFVEVVKNLEKHFPNKVRKLRVYLDRHIEVDDERHGPMSERMLQIVINEKEENWKISFDAAYTATQARIDLWTAIDNINKKVGKQ